MLWPADIAISRQGSALVPCSYNCPSASADPPLWKVLEATPKGQLQQHLPDQMAWGGWLQHSLCSGSSFQLHQCFDLLYSDSQEQKRKINVGEVLGEPGSAVFIIFSLFPIFKYLFEGPVEGTVEKSRAPQP